VIQGTKSSSMNEGWAPFKGSDGQWCQRAGKIATRTGSRGARADKRKTLGL